MYCFIENDNDDKTPFFLIVFIFVLTSIKNCFISQGFESQLDEYFNLYFSVTVYCV